MAALELDALEHVRHRFARVDRLLERLEDVLPADDEDGIDTGGEQRRDGVAMQAVGVVLEPMDLDQMGVRRRRWTAAPAARRSTCSEDSTSTFAISCDCVIGASTP